MNDENIKILDESDNSVLTDALLIRFQKIAKEFFKFDVEENFDFKKYLINHNKFYKYQLPPHLNEIFIKYENAPLFWIINSTILSHLKNPANSKFKNQALLKSNSSIYEFYEKWAMISIEEEKQYYGNTTIKLIERNPSQNILNAFLYATILSYDRTIFNPDKSLDLLKKLEQNIEMNSAAGNNKNEFLYLIKLFSGFFFIKGQRLQEAKQTFDSALLIKPAGISAKFYKTFLDLKLNGNSLNEAFIEEIYNFDLERLNFAIQSNNIEMLNYLISNSIFTNFFYYEEFAALISLFESVLSNKKNSLELKIEIVKAKLDALAKKNIEEIDDEEIINNYNFIEKFVSTYSGNDSLWVLNSLQAIDEKINQTIEKVKQVIHEKIFSGIQAKLVYFDDQIQTKLASIQEATSEHEKAKERNDTKLKKSIEQVETKIAEDIESLENQINNLHNIRNFDPKATFNSVMTYDIIVALLVFLLGGCAGYTGNFNGDISDFKEILSVVMLNGIKWSILAFIIGFVIALVTAGVAVIDGASKKQKLLQKISSLKNEKDRQINYLRNNFEEHLKIQEEKFNTSIQKHKDAVDSLRREKAERETEFKSEAEALFKQETAQLNALMN